MSKEQIDLIVSELQSLRRENSRLRDESSELRHEILKLRLAVAGNTPGPPESQETDDIDDDLSNYVTVEIAYERMKDARDRLKSEDPSVSFQLASPPGQMKSKIRRWAQEGRLRFQQPSGNYWIHEDSVEVMINCRGAAPPKLDDTQTQPNTSKHTH